MTWFTRHRPNRGAMVEAAARDCLLTLEQALHGTETATAALVGFLTQCLEGRLPSERELRAKREEAAAYLVQVQTYLQLIAAQLTDQRKT